jgi:hypothetical protein
MRAVAVALAMLAPAAFGATCTWTGAALDGKWSNPANWNGGAPMSGDDVVLPADGLRMSTTNDLPPALELNSLTVAGPYVIGGNGIVLGAGGFRNDAPSGKWEFDNVFAGGVTLSAPQTWSALQPWAAAAHVATNVNGYTLTLSSVPQLVFDRLSGDGTIVQNGSGNTAVAQSTFTGSIVIQSGVLGLTGSAGAVEVAGGGLDLTGASTGNLAVSGPGAVLSRISSTVSNLTFSANAPGTFTPVVGYDTPTLHVTGKVALDNARLNTVLLAKADQKTVVVIDNQGGDPIEGTFMGLPEGAVVAGNDPITPFAYRISYAGGDGNDLTLSLVPVLSATTTSLTATATLLTAHVAAAPYGGAPAGNVSFFDGATLLGTVPLDFAGRAILAVRLAGTHIIRAVYTGTDVFASSDATVIVTSRIRAVR